MAGLHANGGPGSCAMAWVDVEAFLYTSLRYTFCFARIQRSNNVCLVSAG